VRADGEVDLPSRLPELGGDLNTRGPGADHEEVPGGELLRVAVGGGVDLLDAGLTGDDCGDDGLLERPGRRDHEAGVEVASEVSTVKPGRPWFFRTRVTSTPQRIGAAIFFA
jgi:hypothetical protein